jgi:endogenous inhibitor of DNA gyrase (YacG/DUF329 family)
MIEQRCPICGQGMPGACSKWPEHPFCSPRCRTIDLGRWLDERYRIPEPERESAPDSDDSEIP